MDTSERYLMNQVMEKARELAESIVRSTEYRQLQERKAEAAENHVTATLMADYEEKYRMFQQNMHASDSSAREKAREELLQARECMEKNPVYVRLEESSMAFDAMMDSVNQVMRLIIYGENEDAQENCSGTCRQCNGCCR